MELFFNELSLQPQCLDDFEARAKIITFLEAMKAIHEYDFNILRTHDGFYADNLGNGYTFLDFLNDPLIKRDLKTLFQSIVRNPFIVDDDTYEAEAYVLNSFSTTNIFNQMVAPEGIAIAYIFESPTFSLSGHPKWESNTIPLTITNSQGQIFTEDIVNICNIQSINSQTFTNWLACLTEDIQLNSEENIQNVFPPIRFQFDRRAISDIISWYYDDRRYLARIRDLINDIPNNPFVGGKGLTETLANSGGKASKRIVKRDRIIYTYEQQVIIIHQCRGHYDDN